jgi:hypothetical protein
MVIRPVSGSISTSATCTPFGKLSGVSVVVLVSRSSAISALFHFGDTRRDLKQGDAAVGADDLERAVLVSDVALAGFEHGGGDRAALLDDRIYCFRDRVSGGHRRTRADRSIARKFAGGIAVRMRDCLKRNAEALGDDLREHGGMALAGITDIERQQELAGFRKTQFGALGRRAAGMFEHAGDAEAAILAALFRVPAALLESLIVGEFQRLVEHRAEIAGIVSGADRGFIRHRGALDEVSPPQLDRIDAGDARGLVDHALDGVAAFRPSGAAIGRGRNRIGEDAFGGDVDIFDVVHAGQAAGEIRGWDIGADRTDIGAEIADIAQA